MVNVAASFADGLSFGSSTDRIVLDVEIVGDPADHPWSDDPSLPAAGLADFDDAPLPQRRINFQGAFASTASNSQAKLGSVLVKLKPEPHTR